MKTERITIDLLVEHSDDPIVMELFEEVSKFLKLSQTQKQLYQFNVRLESIDPKVSTLYSSGRKR